MATKKTKTIKKPLGAPSKYDPKYCAIVKQLASKGFIDKEICDILLITEPTFIKWKKDYPELFKAHADGKKEPMERLENALFNRGMGMTIEEKIYEPKMIKGKNGKPVKSKYRMELIRKTKKELPPNEGAAMLYLKNRYPDRWRDKQEIEHSGNIGYKVIPDEIEEKDE